MKLWVDPPSGWMYGFPKIWDQEKCPTIHEWLRAEGYPNPDYSVYVRTWPVEEEDERTTT